MCYLFQLQSPSNALFYYDNHLIDALIILLQTFVDTAAVLVVVALSAVVVATMPFVYLHLKFFYFQPTFSAYFQLQHYSATLGSNYSETQ